MNSPNQFPYGDGFEVIPGKGKYPPVWLAVTAPEASHPDYSELKRRIQAAVNGSRISWETLLPAVYVWLLRVQRVLLVWREEPGLPDRICIALPKIAIWALCLSFRWQSSIPKDKGTGGGQ